MTSTQNPTRPTILTAGVHFAEETRIIRRSLLKSDELQNIPTYAGEYDHARRTQDAADYIVCPSVSDGSEVVFNLAEDEQIEFSTTPSEFGLRFEVRNSLTGQRRHTGAIGGFARVTIAR